MKQDLKLACTGCGARLRVDLGFEGMTVRCSKCGRFLRVPKPDDSELLDPSTIFGRPDSPTSEDAEEDGLIGSRSVVERTTAAAFCPRCRKRVDSPGHVVEPRLRCLHCGFAFPAPLPRDRRMTAPAAAADDDSAAALLASPASSPRLPEIEEESPEARHARLSRRLVNTVEMQMLYVPEGVFLMGSPPDEESHDEEETAHTVRITRGYYLSATPVTQAQWAAVMKDHPSSFKGEHLPVERVRYEEAREFCRRLTHLESGWWSRLRRGDKGRVYRLPTEAEWEYACRAGSPWPFSTGRRLTTRQANFDGRHPYGGDEKGKYRARTNSVNRFPANDWGFHDMHGNVMEWCADYYGPYSADAAVDPTGPPTGYYRVLRGGSWHTKPHDCRSAKRLRDTPDRHSNDTGLRVAMDLIE